MTRTISFQGEPGAYSHQAVVEMFPGDTALPCHSFEGAIAAVREGRADLAMLPVENSTYGRVADIHHLLPESGLHIIDEHFVRVRICLLGLHGAKLSDIREARSHTVALGQCREFLRKHDIHPEVGPDTAGSAKLIAELGNKSVGALASELSGEIYGLDVIARGIEDHQHNTTRFLVMSREDARVASGNGMVMTSFVFRVRNIPAALYKAMGGFATNGVNMVKLESYQLGGTFNATQFYADIEGHPDELAVTRAMEELDYCTDYLKVLGVYPANSFRKSVG